MRAIAERRSRTRDAVPMTVHVVPDEFTAGECSSVVGLINGGRGRPQFVSTIAAVRGVDNRPTLLSNTETFAQLAILTRMGDRYADVGTDATSRAPRCSRFGAPSPRTSSSRPRLGTPLGALINEAGGLERADPGGARRRLPRQVAAPRGRLERAAQRHGDARDRAAPSAPGSSRRCRRTLCPLSEVSRVVGYLASQTAGQCGPCVNGLPTIAQGLAALAHGAAGENMLDRIAEWSGLVAGRGVCKHPDGTVGLRRIGARGLRRACAATPARDPAGSPGARCCRSTARVSPARCTTWRDAATPLRRTGDARPSIARRSSGPAAP